MPDSTPAAATGLAVCNIPRCQVVHVLCCLFSWLMSLCGFSCFSCIYMETYQLLLKQDIAGQVAHFNFISLLNQKLQNYARITSTFHHYLYIYCTISCCVYENSTYYIIRPCKAALGSAILARCAGREPGSIFYTRIS